jgi:hypothetical protein
MNLTEQQYERIARRLDGEAVVLDGAEQAALDQIVADEAALAAMLAEAQGPGSAGFDVPAQLAEISSYEAEIGRLLDVEVPPAAMDRTWRLMQPALARPHRRLLRLAGAAGAIAAAAAVLLIAALPVQQPARPLRPQAAALSLAAAASDALVASMQADRDPAISLLAAEIDQLEAEVIASRPTASLDSAIDQAEEALEELWLYELIIE